MRRKLPETTSPDIEAAQLELMRQASPAKRLALARSLSRTTIELARGAIRRRHPELDEQEVGLRFVEVQYGKELAEKVAAYLQAREAGASS